MTTSAVPEKPVLPSVLPGKPKLPAPKLAPVITPPVVVATERATTDAEPTDVVQRTKLASPPPPPPAAIPVAIAADREPTAIVKPLPSPVSGEIEDRTPASGDATDTVMKPPPRRWWIAAGIATGIGVVALAGALFVVLHDSTSVQPIAAVEPPPPVVKHAPIEVKPPQAAAETKLPELGPGETRYIPLTDPPATTPPPVAAPPTPVPPAAPPAAAPVADPPAPTPEPAPVVAVTPIAPVPKPEVVARKPAPAKVATKTPTRVATKKKPAKTKPSAKDPTWDPNALFLKP